MISKPIPPSIYAYDCDLDYYDACEKYEQDCEYYYNRDADLENYENRKSCQETRESGRDDFISTLLQAKTLIANDRDVVEVKIYEYNPSKKLVFVMKRDKLGIILDDRHHNPLLMDIQVARWTYEVIRGAK